MPLCLAKRGRGSFALVSAEDEVELVDLLDQLADPGAESWQGWDGPVWLEVPRLAEGLPPEAEIDPIGATAEGRYPRGTTSCRGGGHGTGAGRSTS